jgi:hypothetical protein
MTTSVRDAIVLLPMLAVLAAACDRRHDLGPPPDPRPLALRIDGPSQIVPGIEAQFLAIQTWTDGSNRDVTASAQWTSSNPAVLSVNAGSTRALAAGEVGLTAQLGPLTTQPKSVQVIPTTTEWNGSYLLTISAGPCNESLPLPPQLRQRAYTAFIQQSGLFLAGSVALTASFGGRISNPQVRFFFDKPGVRGRRAKVVSIVDSGVRHTAYPLGWMSGFTEIFGDGTRLVITGEANTTMSPAGFSGTLNGELSLYAPGSNSLLAVCQSSAHGFTLVRQ